jgi:hypothetical protein
LPRPEVRDVTREALASNGMNKVKVSGYVSRTYVSFASGIERTKESCLLSSSRERERERERDSQGKEPEIERNIAASHERAGFTVSTGLTKESRESD